MKPDVKKKDSRPACFAANRSPSLLNLFKLMADRQRSPLPIAVLIRFLELFRQRGITPASVTVCNAAQRRTSSLPLRQKKVIAVGRHRECRFESER